ncbi:hypothetical protein KBZ10_18140 [Streptomyces sp. F63]|uniref:hypothetical protein n=1 Tax=Streptomyces sp. F63 TaxID=2824887 RepID=UPI001B36318F|nr:hypothetical protein [Streptomyces sp. F63]MBQ0986396.1 hypothetical protein [Streptomyces sp. F63]
MANEEVQRLARIRMRVTGESYEQALAALQGRAAGTGSGDCPEPGPEETGGAGEAGSAACSGATVIDMTGRERTPGAARARRRTAARAPRAPEAANGEQEERG